MIEIKQLAKSMSMIVCVYRRLALDTQHPAARVAQAVQVVAGTQQGQLVELHGADEELDQHRSQEQVVAVVVERQSAASDSHRRRAPAPSIAGAGHLVHLDALGQYGVLGLLDERSGQIERSRRPTATTIDVDLAAVEYNKSTYSATPPSWRFVLHESDEKGQSDGQIRW